MTVLSDSPSLIIATKLIDLAIFTDPSLGLDFPVFVSFLPDGDDVKDNAAAVYDTKGIKDGRLMNGIPAFFHGIQVTVRSRTYEAGWDKAAAIESAFQTIDQATTILVGGSGGSSYQLANLSQTTPVLRMGQEEGTKRRNLFAINFLTTLKEV